MSEIAYIPVPVQFLPAALQAVADMIAEAPPGGQIPASPLPGGTQGAEMGQNGVGWDEALYGRLADSAASSVVLTCRLLDVLAETPERMVPTSELVGRLDVDRDALRGALGALTRHVKKHFPGLGWPMVMRWGGDLGGDHAMETYYYLTTDQARAWFRATHRGES